MRGLLGPRGSAVAGASRAPGVKAFAGPALALVVPLGLALFAAVSASASTLTPVLQQSAVISRAGGHVTVERPGTSRFVALQSAGTTVPFGTTINASHGRVQVTVATTTPGASATALFYTGEFSITQAATGIATLTLDGPLQPCAGTGAPRVAAVGKAERALDGATNKPLAAAKRPKSRSLWGDGGSGQFMTKGNYAAATVLGTFWLTTDSCATTVVSVAEGSVNVTDLVTNTSSTVTTGQALTVQSTGATTVAPFSGPGANGYAISIAASSRSVKLGNRYSLTATGTAGGSGDAYIYENVGQPCSTTLATEQGNTAAYEFSTVTLTAPGPFTLTAPARARHTGTKYYCAYLTNPAAYAQVIVKVSA